MLPDVISAPTDAISAPTDAISALRDAISALRDAISVVTDAISALVDSLKEVPRQVQPLGMDCYKIRMVITSKGKGKSGGSRVISCVKIVEDSVFLLSIYNKSDKESVSDKELNDLLQMAGFVIKEESSVKIRLING